MRHKHEQKAHARQLIDIGGGNSLKAIPLCASATKAIADNTWFALGLKRLWPADDFRAAMVKGQTEWHLNADLCGNCQKLVVK